MLQIAFGGGQMECPKAGGSRPGLFSLTCFFSLCAAIYIFSGGDLFLSRPDLFFLTCFFLAAIYLYFLAADRTAT